MNEPLDPNETLDNSVAYGPVETGLGSIPEDSLEIGLAAAFGKSPGPPRSSMGSLRPVVLKEAAGESTLIVTPNSDAMPTKVDVGDRYQLSGEIARGGMGAVLRGRDVDLGRDLAVKVLLERHANRPDVAQRFIEEAQIGGQLQHPGVVPVYDIGRFGDRPFFTMKLVKGQTLAAILTERTDPAADRPRLLAMTLQVAQAMAYAHAKGVIHRDLKPANIMVGSFGEVQVMDWGLAKVLAEGGVADEERASRAHQEPADLTTIRTARSTGSHGGFGTHTEAGSILGTPAYMPPEQASGDVSLLDRRADVFALGAILCEILTGKPPYLGRSSEEVRRKAANGDLADALTRLDACGADPELIGLTRACLAREAVDRPRDAQGVVDALSTYLDGVQERLKVAERERAVALAREVEERKRRKVQLALAAAVLAMMLGAGSFTWWRNEQVQLVRQRETRNAEAVSGLLAQAEEALRTGDAARAAVVLDAAKKRSDEGGAEAIADRLGRLEADLALLRDLDAVNQFRLTVAENRFPDAAAVATRTRDVLKRFGADPEVLSEDAAAARISASVVRERIISALDLLLIVRKAAGVRAVLRRLDANPYRDAFRDAVVADDRKQVVALAGQPIALEQPPGFVAFLGEPKAIPVERRRQLLQAALGRRPQDLGLLMALGGTYPIDQQEWADDNLRWYQAAIASAPAYAAAHNNLGVALREKGQVDEAITSYKKAIELDPKTAMAHTNLGVALRDKGQLDEAIASHKKAIELDPKLDIAHFSLGNVLRDKGQVDEAITSYKKAIELDPKYANAHVGLGIAIKDKGQLDEAIACYKQAIELDPKLDIAHYSLGNVLSDKGQLDEAVDCYKKAIELDPNYAEAHCNLGELLATQGHFADSLYYYQRGHELGTKQPGWNYPSVEWVREAEVKAALEAKLPAFLKSEFQPSSAEERLGLAGICRSKKLHRTAAGLFAAAFAADPKLADDLKTGHRYSAASCATLAAAGQGEDAAGIDDTGRAGLRRQALGWLRADLVLRARQTEFANPSDRTEAEQALRHWQQDADLATVREAEALAKLPEAERTEWQALWTEVKSLLMSLSR